VTKVSFSGRRDLIRTGGLLFTDSVIPPQATISPPGPGDQERRKVTQLNSFKPLTVTGQQD
jgi:hypothetical protein